MLSCLKVSLISKQPHFTSTTLLMTQFCRNALAQRKKDKGNYSMTTTRVVEQSGAFIISYPLAEMAKENKVSGFG